MSRSLMSRSLMSRSSIGRSRGVGPAGRERSRRRPWRGDAGSVFVETLIAAAIVATALGSTFQVIADSAARERGAEARRTALLLAQSELADVGSEIAIVPGRSSGEWGALVWRVDIEPYGGGDAANPVGQLYQVTVHVHARSGGPALATLRSLRLGREA
jgi:hypothetical protein